MLRKLYDITMINGEYVENHKPMPMTIRKGNAKPCVFCNVPVLKGEAHFSLEVNQFHRPVCLDCVEFTMNREFLLGVDGWETRWSDYLKNADFRQSMSLHPTL
jgi:hypothetical protein